MKRILILSCVLLAAAAACTSRPGLVIIHTNDTHSHLEPERTGERRGCGGVIERTAFIDSVRTAEGEDNVLLLHAGDFNQGSSYYTELGGELELDLMNAVGYDCITLGNHEFDNGIEHLSSRLSRLEKTIVVCSNLDLSPFELGNHVRPYAVIEKGAFRVGIIGLAPDLSSVVSKTISSRIPQLDNEEVVNRYSAVLRDKERCDLVILLSHIGYDEDCALVPVTHGVDLVVGGHSHTRLDEPVTVNDADGRPVRIVTDGCWGLDMGLIRIYR